MHEAIAETAGGLRLPLILRVRGGLHARPAAALAREAQRFTADIRIETEHGRADAKSMLDVLSLALPQDAEFVLTASGPDARAALEGLAACLDSLRN